MPTCCIFAHSGKIAFRTPTEHLVCFFGIGIAFGNVTGTALDDLIRNFAIEGFFCGAGDVFASAFVGCLAKGKSQTEAIKLASDFTAAAIRRSAKEVPDKKYGLNFEAEIFTFLKNLNA